MIKYVNSKGEAITLNEGRIRLKDAVFADYEWSYEIKKRRFGAEVTRFTKAEKIYNLTFALKGTETQKKEKLEEFYRIVEYDVVSNKPGKLYKNEEYVNCFIVASKTVPQKFYCEKTVKVLCPYPLWNKEKKSSYPIFDGNESNNFLNFPFNFPFNFTSGQKGISVLENDHYTDANFKVTIYGPAVNPVINIGGYPYEVNTTVEANEYLVIDSTKNTVTRTLTDGTTVDEYNSRSFENSVFRPIPPGNNSVLWSGDFGWDITLYQERSEPKW